MQIIGSCQSGNQAEFTRSTDFIGKTISRFGKFPID